MAVRVAKLQPPVALQFIFVAQELSKKIKTEGDGLDLMGYVEVRGKSSDRISALRSSACSRGPGSGFVGPNPKYGPQPSWTELSSWLNWLMRWGETDFCRRHYSSIHKLWQRTLCLLAVPAQLQSMRPQPQDSADGAAPILGRAAAGRGAFRRPAQGSRRHAAQ